MRQDQIKKLADLIESNLQSRYLIGEFRDSRELLTADSNQVRKNIANTIQDYLNNLD